MTKRTQIAPDIATRFHAACIRADKKREELVLEQCDALQFPQIDFALRIRSLITQLEDALVQCCEIGDQLPAARSEFHEAIAALRIKAENLPSVLKQVPLDVSPTIKDAYRPEEAPHLPHLLAIREDLQSLWVLAGLDQ